MIIPKEVQFILDNIKRKDARERFLKVYEALIYKRGGIKGGGYFQCPSQYLKKVSNNYQVVIQKLIEHKILDFQSFNTTNDLFNPRRKKYYNTENGTCMRYRFLIDVETGEEFDLKIETNLYEDKKWYWRTRTSLLQLNFPPDGLHIKRDNFSRRLHTNITGQIGEGGSYKDLLSGGEYWSIDAKTCHPRLLWLSMKENNQCDEKLEHIFTNNIDFYDYMIEHIPSITEEHDKMVKSFIENNEDYVYDEEHIRKSKRSIAKDVFMLWCNGKGYFDPLLKPITKHFWSASSYISSFKSQSYKDLSRYLQWKEATIFIDDLLENIDLDFCLTVHDSLIVKKEDVHYTLNFCRERYPDMVFVASEIKK